MVRFRALNSTTLSITCWKDNLAQQFLGCSKKEYYFFVEKGNLLRVHKIQEMTELLNKRQGLINSLSKILTKMTGSALTWFLSSGFPNKSNAFFVFSSLLSGV